MKKQRFVIPSLNVEDLSNALYETNKELTRTNKQLKDSERKRLELLANLSHDFRSPIATIRNYTEYLLSLSAPNDQEVFSVLGHIQSKVLALEHLCNEMLELSNLDASSEEHLHYENLKIGPFLEEFFYLSQADLKYKDCEMILDVPPDFPHYVNMDTKLICRVLENLFTNALKFSPPPCSITLDACCRNHMVIVSVADKGIGVSKPDLEKIFERTYKVSSPRTPSNTSGCGLGLSIAESIVHRHKGRIWCESVLGKGSTFYFTLPETVP